MDKVLKQTKYLSNMTPENLSYNLCRVFNDGNERTHEEKNQFIKNIVNSSIYKATPIIKSIESEKRDNFNNLVDSSEYCETIYYNGNLIVIGLDDSGQSYFIVYKDMDSNDVKIEFIGSYISDIWDYIEWRFGEPSMCEHNDNSNIECEYKDKGYCDKCKRYDYKEYLYQKLLSMGVLDRRGNVSDEFSSILSIID